MQLQELKSRFTEVNTELFLCVTCLNPYDSFVAFDKQKLIRLTQFYSQIELIVLNDQLETYIIDMCYSNKFFDLKGIDDLTQKMLRQKTHCVSTCLFSCYIGFDPICSNCKCGENIFCCEYSKKSTMKSNGRSIDE